MNDENGNASFDDALQMDYSKASKNLIIITYSNTEHSKRLYTCSKTGENLKLLTRFGEDTGYDIDSVNNRVILRKQSGRQLVIESFPY